MSGQVGDLSPHQNETLIKFKAALSDVWNDSFDDYYLLRWLRARRFNLAKAEAMLRNHLEFRKTWRVDTILEDYKPPEVIVKYFPSGIFGVDRDGNPITWNCFGNMDLRGCHRAITREQFIRHVIYLNEKMAQLKKELSKKAGRVIETHTSVEDMEYLSIQRHYYWPGIKMLQEYMTIFEDNYPEIIKQFFVIKAPRVFPIAYNIMKPFLDENTRRKMKMFGRDWQEQLQKYIDPDNIPAYYGGNRNEPDPQCSDYLCLGGDIPPKYYMTNLTETSQEEMEMIQVGKGSTTQVEYTIDTPGSCIRYEFITKDYDIGFGIYHKPLKAKARWSAGSMTPKVKSERRNSHIVPESGFHICETTGIYVLRFDNTYSWTRTKEVKYSARVLPPDTEICQTDGFNGYDEQGELSASKRSTSDNSKDNDDEFEDAQIQNLKGEAEEQSPKENGENGGWMSEAAAVNKSTTV